MQHPELDKDLYNFNPQEGECEICKRKIYLISLKDLSTQLGNLSS